MRIEDFTGLTFGWLTVVKQSESQGGRRTWECNCKCGRAVVVKGRDLVRKHTMSCGCYKKACMVTHGESLNNRTREYQTWDAMIQRCTNKNNKAYSNYGGRGVIVCDRWRYSYENFINDMGRRPSSGHSLERINNELGYNPTNCKWATRKDQARNRRSNRILEHSGRKMVMQDWAIELGISETTIITRLKAGEEFCDIYNRFKSKLFKV